MKFSLVHATDKQTSYKHSSTCLNISITKFQSNRANNYAYIVFAYCFSHVQIYKQRQLLNENDSDILKASITTE